MTAQWDYRMVYVVWDHTRESTRRNPRLDWVVTFTDTRWEGWNEILNNLGDQGWEIFQIDKQVDSNMGTSTGAPKSYTIFAKKPR